MATVILQDHRTIYLENIIETLKGASPKNLYLAIGRAAAWDTDTTPDIPVNSKEEQANFFTNVLAAQLVSQAEISPIVRRVDWEVGGAYVVFDETSDTSFNSDFYVKNSENNVYRVVSKVPASVAVTEPVGTASGSVIDTLDGYTWQFLYNIEGQNVSLLTNNWMPVTYDTTITASQTADGDLDAFRTLGAINLIVQSQVSDALIPETLVYRQLALVLDMTDNSDVLLTGSAVLTADIKQSGYMLHIENRKPITRSAGQTETFQTILKVF